MFVFNLCGEYVCQDPDYCNNVLTLLPYIKFLFGNKSEYEVFLKTVSCLDIEEGIRPKMDKLINGATASNEIESDEDCDIGEDIQFAIVTNSNQPVQCFSMSTTNYSSTITVPDLPLTSIKARLT